MREKIIKVGKHDIDIYHDVDGFKYGALFKEQFAQEKNPGICMSLWGVGDTREEVIENLLFVTEEWNVIYEKQNIKFELK